MSCQGANVVVIESSFVRSRAWAVSIVGLVVCNRPTRLTCCRSPFGLSSSLLASTARSLTSIVELFLSWPDFNHPSNVSHPLVTLVCGVRARLWNLPSWSPLHFSCDYCHISFQSSSGDWQHHSIRFHLAL